MRSALRILVGGLCGVTGAMIWAVSLAVYQQLMEPTGFVTDSNTGQAYPSLASNNTYWPRETRHLAVLLVFAGVAVICRARTRALAAGGVSSVVWLGADLWLDRIDIDGRTAAWSLASAGIVAFGATAAVAAWLTRDRPDTSWGRYVAAGTLPVLAALTLFVSTPWDEPITAADQVSIENTLTLLQIGLVVLFLLATLALTVDGLARARAWWTVVFLALAVAAAALNVSTNGLTRPAGLLGPLMVLVCGLLAVSAARDVPRINLAVVAVAGLMIAPVVIFVVFYGGMIAGQIMTSIAGNPAVNGADTDLTYGLPGLIIGVLVAMITYVAASSTRQATSAVPAVAEP